MTKPIPRRSFLTLATSSTLALVCAGCADSTSPTDSDSVESGGSALNDLATVERPASVPPLDDVLRAYFEQSDMSSVVRVGTFWLGQLVTSPEGLAERYETTVDIWSGTTNVEDAIELIRDSVHTEFLTLQVESLNGWQLSPTELVLTGLAR